MESRIISCVGEKGGVGKSTLNCMLATNLVLLYGKSVVLIDMDDPQYSLYKKRLRENSTEILDDEKEIPYPVETASVDTLRSIIKKYYGIMDYIIVDFPGSINREMVTGLYFIEHVFIPFSHDELEVDSTTVFYNTLKNNYLDDEKAALKSVHVFFNRYEKVKKNKFAKLRKLVAGAGIDIMDSVVLDRTIYKEEYRSTIYPIPKNRENGEKEIKQFFDEIIKISK